MIPAPFLPPHPVPGCFSPAGLDAAEPDSLRQGRAGTGSPLPHGAMTEKPCYGAANSKPCSPCPFLALQQEAHRGTVPRARQGPGQALGAGRGRQVRGRRQGMSGTHPDLGSALFFLLLFGRAMRNPNITINAESILALSRGHGRVRRWGIQAPVAREPTAETGQAGRGQGWQRTSQQDRPQVGTDRQTHVDPPSQQPIQCCSWRRGPRSISQHRACQNMTPTPAPAPAQGVTGGTDMREGAGGCRKRITVSCSLGAPALLPRGAALPSLAPCWPVPPGAADVFPMGHPLWLLSPSLKSLGLQGWIFLSLSSPSGLWDWTISWGTTEARVPRPEMLTAPHPAQEPAGAALGL